VKSLSILQKALLDVMSDGKPITSPAMTHLKMATRRTFIALERAGFLQETWIDEFCFYKITPAGLAERALMALPRARAR